MTNNAQLITNKGGIQISAITINGHDINPFMLNTHIFEDIFSPVMTGFMSIMDTVGIIENLPIKEWQTLSISFKTADDKNVFPENWTKDFVIYKIGDISPSNKNAMMSRTFTIYFISTIYQKNQNVRINRSFSNMTESDVVANICTNLLKIPTKNQIIEPTKYTRTFIIPNQHPFKAIESLTTSAVRSSGFESCDYLFFENIKGSNFVSLSKLVEQQADQNGVTRNIAKTAQNQIPIRNMKNMMTANHVDIGHATHGIFNNRFIGIDTLNKKFKTFDYSYQSEFQQMSKLDGNNDPITDQDFDAPGQVLIGPYNSSNDGSAYCHSDSFMTKRAGHIGIWSQNVMVLEISSDSKLYTGMKIPVDVPASDGTDKNSTTNKRTSGNWIVTAIHHRFNSSQHEQIIEVRKPMLKSAT